ncbi:hypothetical protein G4B88_001943 [Cannabis sativa]|uniref:Protein kinase domain-containing protein n=1 Tax=Cannabis sativa TaxID=3483 RepID=A0A7J6HFA6_CANSA|nr:hypothetical protein G4B88_001943 [Cannabis sativa]
MVDSIYERNPFNINYFNQQTRYYARDPFPNKVSHYLYRAKLIDSIRLALRSNPSKNSLEPLLSDRVLDSFVVTHALRSAPSADSALSFIDSLERLQQFSHNQNTLHSLATVLAKSRRSVELKSLINSIKDGNFGYVRISFMNLMQWYAAVGDLESVLQVWDEYRVSNDKVCTESYNIVMRLYAQMGDDSEAVKVFYRLVDEGAIPNCRTYTIMIEHLVNSGMLCSAMEVFKVLPLMRIKRTLNQYSLLAEGFTGVKQFDKVKTLLEEMQVDGILPGRAMNLSLERMKEAGFVEETEKFLKEMLPNKQIKNIECCVESSDEDENDGSEDSSLVVGGDSVEVQLKPWIDPRALASALQKWNPEEVKALEEAKFVWTSRLFCKILRNINSPETAWKFFCWVACQPGFTHDIYTVQRTMTLLARHGCAELVDKLIFKIRKEGMRLPFCTIRLIIDFYGISKNADAALKVFHDHRDLCGTISKFNMLLLYSSLLRTLTKCRRNSDALDVLEEMILQEICPDIQTFSGLMHHFAVHGDIKTVQKLFQMVKQSGIKPDAYMFKVLIQAYCKCERAALAWRVFEDMRNLNLTPDFPTKELLVQSLWKEGKRREAAAVEENCEEISDVLPLRLRGHIWTVSSADFTRLTAMALLLYLLLFFITHVSAQSPPTSGTNFSCSANSPSSCQTYAAYFAQSPNYIDLNSIANLFGVSSLSISEASNLLPEQIKLIPGQLLLIPLSCSCNGSYYFANITHNITMGESYYLVSTYSFENLTKWPLVRDMNPELNPNLLQIGTKVVFPLYCGCPLKSHLENDIKYLISYVWQPEDDIVGVGAKFNATEVDIVTENNYRNFTDAVGSAVLIPVSRLPSLSQPPYPSQSQPRNQLKGRWFLITVISLAGTLLVLFLATFLLYTLGFYRKKKKLNREDSSLESSDLIRTTKGDNSKLQTKDKLLPGVSGYLGKLIMYEIETIIEATMNFDEQYRIGGSVYRAMIHGSLLAVKKAKQNVSEELNILQKVNHGNLVKLMGISLDKDGECFFVYEYAKNGSLDKWLNPKCLSSGSSSSGFLTWSQRLSIALDVSHGLQYMHEHTQPSIVHRDIRTSNILLDSRFKAKIANFSMASPATAETMTKSDVFAFGVVLLELLSGRKSMATRASGEIIMLWKEARVILEDTEKRVDKAKEWIDPKLEKFYPIEGALNLISLAKACTEEKASARPSMADVVFSLSVLTESFSHSAEASWNSTLEGEDIVQITSPIDAR